MYAPVRTSGQTRLIIGSVNAWPVVSVSRKRTDKHVGHKSGDRILGHPDRAERLAEQRKAGPVVAGSHVAVLEWQELERARLQHNAKALLGTADDIIFGHAVDQRLDLARVHNAHHTGIEALV